MYTQTHVDDTYNNELVLGLFTGHFEQRLNRERGVEGKKTFGSGTTAALYVLHGGINLESGIFRLVSVLLGYNVPDQCVKSY